MPAEDARDAHGEAFNEPRRCRAVAVRVAGSLAAGSGQPGPLPPARKRTGAGRCPPRRYPAPRRSTHAVVTRRGPARSASWPSWSSLRQVCRSPGERSQAPGRNAAHCQGRPLHPQGHPEILSNRSAKPASQKASSGPTLARGASTDPAGLTARARPEARPYGRAANLREEDSGTYRKERAY